MIITNETYLQCHQCGIEAKGLDDINRIFGYKIVDEKLMPYLVCRSCREKEESEIVSGKRKGRERQWASAASWGRRIHIGRKKFDSYLVDLGYLENGLGENNKRGLVITEKGKAHSATTNATFRKTILWDFEVFENVMKMRVGMSILHECCPKCNAYLDTMPGYIYKDYSHKCKRCGAVCEQWNAKVVFDR